MSNIAIIILNEGQPKAYRCFNQLVDENEKEIREYLKQKDAMEAKKREELLASMKKQREELALRLKGLDADIQGMENL